MNYEYSPAFLANMADRLSDAICEQTAELNRMHGSITPVKSTSTMLYLIEHGPSSIMQLAKALNYSHQLMALRIKPLEQLGLVERKIDKNDKRRKLISLTEDGLADGKILKSVINKTAKNIKQKFQALNIDLMEEIETMILSFQKEPLT